MSIGSANILFAALTYRLTHCGSAAFGMRTYKKVGTDPQLLACYSMYQRFCSTLKLDWLLQLEILAFSLLGLQEFTWQWWLTVGVQLPIALAWLPLGLRAARKEAPLLMALLLLCASTQPFVYTAQLLTLRPHNGTSAPSSSEPWPAHGDAGANGDAWHDDGLLLAPWAESAGGGSRSLLPLADGAPLSPAGLVGAPRQSSYCTQRLRERTFPFASAPLNIVYLFAVLTRLIFVSVALRVRHNFGRGLAVVLHGRRSDSSRAAGSSFSSGVHDPVLGTDSSVGSVAAAAEYLLPRPVADEGVGPSNGLMPPASEHGAPYHHALGGSVGGGGGEEEAAGMGGMRRGRRTEGSGSTEPQPQGQLSRTESTESSCSTRLQRLTIGDGSLSTLGPGSIPGSFVGAEASYMVPSRRI